MGRTIKNGRFCIYNGNEFKVNRDSDGNTIILTKNDKIIDATFIDKNGSGVYSKKVSLEEIEELYRYATYAVINNYKVNVEKENEEYYFVGTADCKVAGALGLQRWHHHSREINKLRLTDVKDLTKEQIAQMKAIREAVPKIDANTYIQKTIPASDIDKYIGEDGWSTIGGYVARYDDVSHIKGYDNVVESSRLDYVTGDGVRPYPEGGDTYAYIKFKTTDAEKIKTPYGEIFGGTNTDGPPCTLNGFTGARNGQIIPEWSLSGEYVKPKKGAELHKVVNGKDTVVAIFDGKHFVEVKGK